MAYFWRTFGVRGRKKRSNFAASNERYEMNIFGGIGFIAALKRYKDAKTAYKKEQKRVNADKSALLVAIDEYDEAQRSGAMEYYDREPETVTRLSGVKIVPKLYFGWEKMSSKYYLVKGELNILNLTDKTITIKHQADVVHDFVMAMNICGHEDGAGTGDLDIDITIQPHKGVIVTYPLGALVPGNSGDWVENLVRGIIKKYLNGAVPKTEAFMALSNAFQDANEQRVYSPKLAEFEEQYGKAEGQRIFNSWKRMVPDPGDIANVPKGLQLVNAMTADLVFYYMDNENKNIRRAVFENLSGVCEWIGNHPKLKDNELVWRVASVYNV